MVRRVMHTLRTLTIAGTLGLMPFSGAWAQDGSPALSAQRRRGPAGENRPMVAAISRPPLSHLGQSAPVLPPLPDGTVDLKFSDFYKTPVGPRGLEPSERLKELDGKKVRLGGYFVFEDWSVCSCPSPGPDPRGKGRALPGWMKHVVPGRTLFAPLPVAVSYGHYALCDDLPPQVAYLYIASRFGEPVFYRPGFYTATGILELGNRDEPDGRISHVRLKVENDADLVAIPPLPPAAAPAASTAQPTALQTNTPTP